MRCAKKWKTCECPWFNYREADNAEWVREDDAVNNNNNNNYHEQYNEQYAEIYLEREYFARQYILARRLGVYNDPRAREEPEEANPRRLDVMFATA